VSKRPVSRPAAWAALLVVLSLLAACGGDGESGSGSQPQPTTTTLALHSTRNITATVSGRKLVGQCTGLPANVEAPTVLLEVGMGAPRHYLTGVENHLSSRTQVCSYDRAGKGASDPAKTPRPVTQVISDAHAFLEAAAKQGAKPPYFLVGQSFGAVLVIQYAQAYPDEVAGFVSINPGPPYKTNLKLMRQIQTEAEIREFELPFPHGDNDEGVVTTSDESMLTDPLPADMPYAIMFDAGCEELPPPLQGRKCRPMLDAFEQMDRALARVGKGGRYVRVKGAGHDIHVTRPEAVMRTIDQVWKEAVTR
jgi:pimeloyl-ACP methyl ester carboxylesterase